MMTSHKNLQSQLGLSKLGWNASLALGVMWLLLPVVAMASGGAEHGAEAAHGGHGPGQNEVYQAINFVLFVGGLAFVLRKKVRAYFMGRDTAFKQLLLKADGAKTEAEARKRDIEVRLAKLESGSADTLANARAEAELLKSRMLTEAEQLRRSLSEDAERSVAIELERARAELRAEMIAQAATLAKATLTEKMKEPDQKRLQNEFVEKIQVVQ